MEPNHGCQSTGESIEFRVLLIGALNLFRTERGPLDQEDLAVAQALADVATIAILQHRQTADSEVINRQLATALESRILIEQAKGVIAERHAISTDDAFARLRKEARDHNRRLVDLARQVVEGASGSSRV